MNAHKVMELRNGPNLEATALAEALTWLTQDLGRTLNEPIKARDYWFDLENKAAYATCKLTTGSVYPPFALSWEAVLSLKAGAEGPPEVAAAVFLFSGGDRLGRFIHYGSDTLHMIWSQNHWSTPVWVGDEFGEWENITRAHEGALSVSMLINQRIPYEAVTTESQMPQEPFATTWTLSSSTGVEGYVILSMLGERVGRLMDAGRSYIAVTRLPGSDWLIEGWRTAGVSGSEQPL